MNVVHSVEKIEKILMADPKSQDVAIFMSDERYAVTLYIDFYLLFRGISRGLD